MIILHGVNELVISGTVWSLGGTSASACMYHSVGLWANER